MIASRIPAAVLSFVALSVLPLSAGQGQSSCDAHSAHSKTASGSTAAGDHHAKVNERGDAVMGFDHETTTHHFRLTAGGGAIEITANDQADTESRAAIRSHLSHIAKMFAAGNYQAPMLIHDQVPPGVPVMIARKAKLRWTYEDLPAGARLVVATKDPDALSSIHDFLRFQIEDHQTGDVKEVPASPAQPSRH
jgi:TusA-related sulfurtransferase